jgi:hypothetical protein
MTVFLALLFTILPLHAQDEFGVTRGPNGELSLVSKSCNELKDQVKALCEWKYEADKVSAVEAPICKTLPAGKFRITISKCLPKFAKSEHMKKLANEGPNCWGTAMSFHGLFPKPRFMWPEELQYWMESPICRKLDVGEPKKAGDVINVYAPEYLFEGDLAAKDPGIDFWDVLYPGRTNKNVKVETGYTGYQRMLHSETYISDKLSFGKNSPAQDDRWEFHSINSMYGRPRSPDEECQENQSMVPNFRQYKDKPTNVVKCKYFTQAHRCENFQEYFKKEAKTVEEVTILENITALQDVQAKLFPLVTSSVFTLTKAEIKLYVGLAEITQKKAEVELKKPGLSKTHEMLLVHEFFTAAGIKKSLQQAGLVK